VSLPVRVRVLFGGFASQFGWLWLGFGLIFVWGFTIKMNLKDWRDLQGELENTRGVITKMEEHTSYSGGRNSTSRTTYWHYYSFKGPDSIEYTNFSYADSPWTVGKEVTILYPKGRPEVSRVKGMRTNVVGPMGLIPIIFPVIGLCFIIAGLKNGIKANRLLVNGKLANGRLKSKVKTKSEINDQPVYKLTFEFTASDGMSYEAVAKTHLPEKLEDQQEEPLLFDPACPKNAVMLDNLPGAPRINNDGNVRVGSPIMVLLCLVIPIISIVGNSVYIYIKFLS
jgi:hypothetical protein